MVHAHGNTYEFYEIPKSDTPPQNWASPEGLDYESNPIHDTSQPLDEHDVPPEDIEINNKPDDPYTHKTNISGDGVEEGQKTLIREIKIPIPIAEGRKRPVHTPKPEKAVFVF